MVSKKHKTTKKPKLIKKSIIEKKTHKPTKKGFEMSMNVIIMAAIALVVLVVVLFIFNGKVRAANQEIGACQSRQGVCMQGVGSLKQCPTGMAKVTAECNPTTYVCCIDFTSQSATS